MRLELIAHRLPETIEWMSRARGEVNKRWKKSMFSLGAEAVRFVKRVPRGAGETTSTATAVRTGRLRNAYSHDVSQDGRDTLLRVGIVKAGAEALKYAAIHEYGGTIRARNGGALAIPLPAAMTDRGVTRASPREWPNTFILKGRGYGGIICQKQADGGILPLFVLKRSVTIKARPALEPARKLIQPRLVARLRNDVVDAIGAAV